MSKSLSNSFGLVCLFGLLLLLFCFHNQENLILVIAHRTLLTSFTSKDNINNGLSSKDNNLSRLVSKDYYSFYSSLTGKLKNSNGLTSTESYNYYSSSSMIMVFKYLQVGQDSTVVTSLCVQLGARRERELWTDVNW